MDELNPNHRVTRTLHDHWHKVAFMLLVRLGGRVVITTDEIARIQSDYGDGSAIVCKDSEGKLTFWIASEQEAKELARKEGGLPQ